MWPTWPLIVNGKFKSSNVTGTFEEIVPFNKVTSSVPLATFWDKLIEVSLAKVKSDPLAVYWANCNPFPIPVILDLNPLVTSSIFTSVSFLISNW